MKKKSSEIIQNHHLVYPSEKNKEYTETISRTEHWIAHQVFRHTKDISDGFLRVLEYYILIHKKEAKEL